VTASFHGGFGLVLVAGIANHDGVPSAAQPADGPAADAARAAGDNRNTG